MPDEWVPAQSRRWHREIHAHVLVKCVSLEARWCSDKLQVNMLTRREHAVISRRLPNWTRSYSNIIVKHRDILYHRLLFHKCLQTTPFVSGRRSIGSNDSIATNWTECEKFWCERVLKLTWKFFFYFLKCLTNILHLCIRNDIVISQLYDCGSIVSDGIVWPPC